MMYFKVDDSPFYSGKYMIKPNFDELPLKNTSGSYAVLPARLFGITYANYLRFCRDEYGAEIIGKNNYYPIPYFNEVNQAKNLIQELNKRVEKLLR